MSIDQPPATNGHGTPNDREWMLKALRGDITTDAAYSTIKAARMQYDDGTLHKDPEALAALANGDNTHLDDARRFERLEQSWLLDIDEDPETVQALETIHQGAQQVANEPYIDPELDEFLATQEPDYDWIVDGLLERGDRVIVTGEEGQGKSTLLRQISVQLASGLDPFTCNPIQPVQVLYIDCENSARQVRRKLRDLRAAADTNYQAGRLRLRILGHAIDLSHPEVEEDIAARVDAQAVDVIVIGPLYKLIFDDPNKEMPAKAVADAIDRLRAIRGSGIIIEAHSPYAEGNGKKRVMRPYGASLWSRWPEFGIHLGDTGAITHWRGQREERAWPKILEHSKPWPWAPAPLPPDSTSEWVGPTECAAAIVTVLTDLGTELTTRKIADELRARGLAYRDETIRTAARIAANDGRLTHRVGARGSDNYTARTGENTHPETQEEMI